MEPFLTVYHGSKREISQPHADDSRVLSGFGAGFYVTPFRQVAGEWACRDAEDGVVSSYRLDMQGLAVLDFTADKYNVLNWAATMLQHQTEDEFSIPTMEARKAYLIEHYAVDIAGCDMIYAWRTDGSFFFCVEQFLSALLSVEGLDRVITACSSDMQIVLKTQKAMDALCFLGSEPVRCQQYGQQDDGGMRFIFPADNRVLELVKESAKAFIKNAYQRTSIFDLMLNDRRE